MTLFKLKFSYVTKNGKTVEGIALCLNDTLEHAKQRLHTKIFNTRGPRNAREITIEECGVPTEVVGWKDPSRLPAMGHQEER